jgi:hypothetical protein
LLPVTEKAKIKLFRRIYLGPEITISYGRDIIDCDACLKKATDERNDAMKLVRREYENLEKWNKGIKPDCAMGPYDPDDKCDISCKEADGGGVIPGYPKSPACCGDKFLRNFGYGLWTNSGIPDLISALVDFYNITTPNTPSWWQLGHDIIGAAQGFIDAAVAVMNVWKITDVNEVASIHFGYPTKSYKTTAFFEEAGIARTRPSPRIPGTAAEVQAVHSFDQYAFYRMALEDPEWSMMLQKRGYTKVFRETNARPGKGGVDVMITPRGMNFIRDAAKSDAPILHSLGGLNVKATEYNNALKLIESNRLDIKFAAPEYPGAIDLRKVEAFYAKYSGPAVRFGPAEVNALTGVRFEPIAETFGDLVRLSNAAKRSGNIVDGVRESDAILYAALRGGTLVAPTLNAIGAGIGAPAILSLSDYFQEFFVCMDAAAQYRTQESGRLYGNIWCRDLKGECRDPEKLPPVPTPPVPDPWTECRCVPAIGDPNAKCPEPEKWRKCVGEAGIIQLKWIEAVKRCCANPECKPPKVKSAPKICLNIQNLDDPRKKNIPPTDIRPDGTPYDKEPYDYPLPTRKLPTVPYLSPGLGPMPAVD